MPWLETDVMKQRVKFVLDYESGLYTMTELCERFGISRETGYKAWVRYQAEGLAGLEDRPRAPKSCPHKTASAVEREIIKARQKYRTWGPVTLLGYLERTQPQLRLPAASTAGDILKRAGLVQPRRRRRQVRHPGRPYVQMASPNDVWTADFKGEFRMRDGRYCYPLTVLDGYSRYLFACRARYSTEGVGARSVFKWLFYEHGLPLQILTDNGSPFASTGLGGLSKLSVWWIKLGIHPIRIQPGRPQQNGRHERMHRTLKADALRPACANLAAQQRAFERFRHCYNDERPHRSLHGQVPASLYEPSPRPFPQREPPIGYPAHFEVRKVCANGCVKWHDQFVFVSHVLAGEPLGFEPIDDGIWSIHFGPVLLARFDERDHRVVG
jgi:putative transposase